MFDVENENLDFVIAKERVIALKGTDEWAEFAERFDTKSDSNLSLLAELFEEKLGDDPSVSDYQRLLRNVFLAGGAVRIGGEQFEFETVPAIEEEIVEPEVPRDRNGNVLSASQLAWKSYREYSESHSMAECKQRAKVDAGFGSFMRKNLEREMNEGGVGDAVQNLNARTETNIPATDDLKVWVAEYWRTPSEKVRSLRRPDSNPLGYQLYNRRMQEAIDAGLI